VVCGDYARDDRDVEETPGQEEGIAEAAAYDSLRRR
jgi:hypothetical protein